MLYKYVLGISVLSIPLTSIASSSEVECLSHAVYYEMRGKDYNSQKAVANVVLNRTLHNGFRKTVCGVIAQPGQFPWYKHRWSKKHSGEYKIAAERSKEWYYQFKQGKLHDTSNGSLFFSSNGYHFRNTNKSVKVKGMQLYKIQRGRDYHGWHTNRKNVRSSNDTVMNIQPTVHTQYASNEEMKAMLALNGVAFY